MKTTSEVAQSHGIVLTNDNAKKFVTRLKKTLKENSIDFKTSQCYDILAKTFGSSNWHELSQHLNNNENINKKTVEKSLANNQLNSIFDLPWVEFKYMVSKMTTYLEFDFHTKEFLDILLDIVHENQPKSEIYWDKINEFLDSSEKNFRTDLEDTPIYNYTVILNPTLTQAQKESYVKKVAKSGHLNGYYRIRFSPEKIESFFNMLRFLKKENFILRDLHTNFALSEVLQYVNNEYTSDYPFVNSLIKLADLNNYYIEYNNNYYKKLSFHDLIINLYSRTSLFGRRIHELKHDIKDFAMEIFENHKFISYLCSHLKKYVTNEISLKVEEKIIPYEKSETKEVLECINIIEYKLNYIPHNLILTHELENLDWSKFTHLLVNPTTKSELDNSIFITVNFKINESSDLINEKNKILEFDFLSGKNFTPNRRRTYVSFRY